MQRYNLYFLITGIILVGLIAGLVVLSVQTSTNLTTNSNNISATQGELASAKTQIVTLNSDLTSAKAQIAILNTDLTSAKTQIATLNTDLTSAKGQIAALNADLTSAKTQIATLNTNLASAESQIATLNADLTTVKSQISPLTDQINTVKTSVSSATASISSLQTQLSTITSQLTTLQSTVTSLKSTVTSLTSRISSLESSSTITTTLFSSQPVSQNYNTRTTLYTFTATYNGYLYISGTSSSSAGYIRIFNNSLVTYIDYTFGTGTTVTAPVTAGYNYSIIFGNTDSSGTITATLTATYNYTSSSSTNTTMLFSSQPVSQNYNTRTTLYSYTVTYNGYFYISGTSSSATGYIRVYNNSLSTYIDYAFGTGTNVTAPVTAGYNYSIIFGNTDSSGTITATLSATYYRN